MLNDIDRCHLHILTDIGLFDLPKHALVERPIGLRLTGKLLVAYCCFVQSERSFFLFLSGCLQTAFGRLRLLEHVL